ncbi:hypothetical protein [Cupriavidus metallidurans]|uniref:hypothetical protein n=1 Tax=Cupriavidus metallidurans TaxID=119219 RepID=UPI001BFCC4FB|nr:hypothetical protein [Cupriavidus metallidurans]QWC88279.1 hypothetical protein KB891_14810 [Cupriavidus metallidurans]
MRKTIGVVIGASSLAWAMCAGAQNQPKTEPQYVQVLQETAFRCKFGQGLATSAMKLDISSDFSRQQRDKAETTCTDALARGESAFKSEIAKPNRPPVREGIKRAYSRWRTFVEGLEPGVPVDAGAERAFNDAVNDLKLEIENP